MEACQILHAPPSPTNKKNGAAVRYLLGISLLIASIVTAYLNIYREVFFFDILVWVLFFLSASVLLLPIALKNDDNKKPPPS